ncbi:hypothetical protein DFH06DRAFT_1272817 [Mycena polygramma]|nr:hypothetical protein DFH06DRAFT_1272817 [Mycena polygramma]
MKTTIMLDITRHAVRDLSGRTPTNGQIWHSIRHQDITRTTTEFTWRCLHQVSKIGEHWIDIPTYQYWEICQHCKTVETMEHILLECEAPGQSKLWKLAQELWELKGFSWPEMSLGRIFACGLVDVQDEAGKTDAGANRLFRILISETAHLIWKFRCTQVIDRGNDLSKYYSEYKLHNKLLDCINSCLHTDTLLTDTKKYGSRALNLKKVLNTWKVKDSENLPEVWV